MSTIAITGASGFVGAALAAHLRQAGARVRPLVRPGKHAPDGIAWDPRAGTVDEEALASADALVHLAGENIAGKRWSESQKQELLESRTLATRGLAQALARMPSGPKVWVSASAVGYYGDRGDAWVDEADGPGSDFLSSLAVAWEEATRAASEAGVRVAIARIGVVLDPSGGALAKMLPAFRLGVGGRLGSGKQGMSWISLRDLVRVLAHLLEEESAQGAFNAVAPQAVSNAAFTRALGKALKRPTVMPLPGFAARLALGEMADAALLSGAFVRPKRLLDGGFRFEDPELLPYLMQVL